MKIGIIVVVIFIFLGAVLFYVKNTSTRGGSQSIIRIEDKVEYVLEIVSDPVSQAKGLSGRESLPEDTGMLFVFSRPKVQHFWMKDMYFPIDVVWIRDFTIIGFSENVLHPELTEGKTARMKSPEVADMVLELNAGQIEKYHLKEGDKLKIERK